MVDDTREDGAPAEAGEDDHDADGDHATGDDAGSDEDAEFAQRVSEARDLLGEDATALYVGVVRDGREVDSTFAQQADDHQQEGMQALSLLASHIRLVSDEAGVDYTTVAADAVTLAEQLDESE
ncbi:hypothetical protein SY89_03118 [Halolamina pelagica]|uniref:DUF8113 domain-containing protein n=1 Tax=Halolamina pelagica TaxID=699431 RepID=A0A0N8HZE8_9EURY|nr:hypothetical protein [Halolamina pelagica]KPN29307.1 hypothetical protein SY89_00020 [Halolamina pelagica]KPN32350.1 hypothetical protein SY89_03118 [Halolamina pelagica]